MCVGPTHILAILSPIILIPQFSAHWPFKWGVGGGLKGNKSGVVGRKERGGGSKHMISTSSPLPHVPGYDEFLFVKRTVSRDFTPCFYLLILRNLGPLFMYYSSIYEHSFEFPEIFTCAKISSVFLTPLTQNLRYH